MGKTGLVGIVGTLGDGEVGVDATGEEDIVGCER
jgi:hypothetical protein